jgi:hypothetical protein
MMMSTNRLIIPAVCRYTQDMDGSDSQPGNCDGRNEAVLDMCGAVSAGKKAEVVCYADN